MFPSQLWSANVDCDFVLDPVLAIGWGYNREHCRHDTVPPGAYHLRGRKIKLYRPYLLGLQNHWQPTPKAMVFPVVMYGCESWTIKKTERRRIDAFKLLCWRRLLRVPWTARRSNQSILKEISPEYSMEVLMLKLQYLATWCKESTHWKRPWCWERWKARGKGDDRGWGSCMASLAQWTKVRANCGGWWRTGKSGVLQSMR